MVASDVVDIPVRAFGGSYAVALTAFVAMFKPPFAFREFSAQSWSVARVSLMPTLQPFGTTIRYGQAPGGKRLHRPESGRLPQRPLNRSAFAVGGAAAFRGTESR